MIGVLALAAAVAACPVERARYLLRGRPDVEATFHLAPVNADWPGGVALAVHIAKTGRTYWALPWNGGTDDRQHIRMVRAPGDNLPADYRGKGGDSDFLSVDAKCNFKDSVPKSGASAPAHLLLPNFHRDVWYSTLGVNRDAMSRAFFDLTVCDPAPHALAAIALPAIP